MILFYENNVFSTSWHTRIFSRCDSKKHRVKFVQRDTAAQQTIGSGGRQAPAGSGELALSRARMPGMPGLGGRRRRGELGPDGHRRMRWSARWARIDSNRSEVIRHGNRAARRCAPNSNSTDLGRNKANFRMSWPDRLRQPFYTLRNVIGSRVQERILGTLEEQQFRGKCANIRAEKRD